MQVSAVLSEGNYGRILTGNMLFDSKYSKDLINDTAFNSLTPFNNKKYAPQDDLPQVYDNINEWKNFCHKQILSGKLDIIA